MCGTSTKWGLKRESTWPPASFPAFGYGRMYCTPYRISYHNSISGDVEFLSEVYTKLRTYPPLFRFVLHARPKSLSIRRRSHFSLSLLYHPLPAIFSPSCIFATFNPTMASPISVLTSAKTFASLKWVTA